MIVIATGPRSCRAPPAILQFPAVLWLGAALFLGAVVCVVLVDSTNYGEGEGLPFVYLVATWSLAVFAYVLLYWHWLRKRKWTPSSQAVALMALMTVPIIVLPYVDMANALSGSRPVHYEGAAVEKRVSRSSRSLSFAVVVRDETLGRKIPIYISGDEYDALKPGDRLACDFKEGGLGVVYRWRLTGQPTCVYRRS
ncbi:MAG: hypothetical protein ACREP7_20560 [Lysobacter sp.]